MSSGKSTAVFNQIVAGYALIEKISESYKDRYVGTVTDGFTANKNIYTYFKEQMNNRSALILEKFDANDYRTFTTDINSALDSAIGSIVFEVNVLKNMYSVSMKLSNLKAKNTVIDATASLRNIIDTNITAYNCFMKDNGCTISNTFKGITTAEKNTYKSSIASKKLATAEYVNVVKKMLTTIEQKLEYCTDISLNTVYCLNNYVSI